MTVDPFETALNETGVGKNGEKTDFRPLNCYVSATIEGRHYNYNENYNERVTGSRKWAFDWYNFGDLE